MMKRRLLSVAVFLTYFGAYGKIPDKCIVPAKKASGEIVRGEEVNISTAVQEVGTSGTHFFGLKVCTSNGDGRLVNIRFLLRTDGSEELFEMPQVGPTLAEGDVTCKKKKLEVPNYYIDTVTVYETEAGVSGIRFAVGKLGETFGTQPEGATETVMNFTEDQQLVSLAGYQSYSGIKSVSLASIDSNCVKLEEKAEEKGKVFDSLL